MFCFRVSVNLWGVECVCLFVWLGEYSWLYFVYIVCVIVVCWDEVGFD